MEAASVDDLPNDSGWQFEPKWDGFRCIAFRDGKRLRLQSKSGKPLERYFPEVVTMLLGLRARQFVLDGEIVVPKGGRFSFDDLLMRLHPAESRVARLSAENPARLIVFDLLVDQRGERLTDLPLAERRKKLAAFAKTYFGRGRRLVLSPSTTRRATAATWLKTGGKGDLDGVMAKRADLPYRSGTRDGMVKIKRRRTADCVVGGFRYATEGGTVGSLLLGLYNRKGLLDHVGFTSGMSVAERKRLTPKLKRLIKPPGFTGVSPNGESRWSTDRSADWEPLATKLVIEVLYDQVTNGRFRHGTRLLRWRGDKAPKQCTDDQIGTGRVRLAKGR